MWYIIFWSHFVCHTNGFSNFVFVLPHIESMCGMNCAIGACLNGKLYRIWIEDEENWNFVRANAFISLHTFDKVFDWTERPQMWITNLLKCTHAQQINAQLPYHFDLAYTWKQCKVNCNNSIAKCPDFSGSLTKKRNKFYLLVGRGFLFGSYFPFVTSKMNRATMEWVEIQATQAYFMILFFLYWIDYVGRYK